MMMYCLMTHLFLVALFTVALSNVALCKCCTMLCSTILMCTVWYCIAFMLHYLILSYSIFLHINVALCDVALFKGILRPILCTGINRKWKVIENLLKKRLCKMFKFLLTFFIDIITPVTSSTQIACDVMCVQHVIH